MACSICKILRLSDEPSETDPLKREMPLRLLSAVVLIDRTLSPSLNIPCYFSSGEIIPEPCDDEELARIKIRAPPVAQVPRANLIAEILRLSEDFRQICLHHRQRGNLETWRAMERRFEEWHLSIHILYLTILRTLKSIDRRMHSDVLAICIYCTITLAS